MAARKKKESLPIEELLAEVSGTIDHLQAGDLSFEESLESYRKAVQILKDCSQRIESAEKELIVLEVDEI